MKVQLEIKELKKYETGELHSSKHIQDEVGLLLLTLLLLLQLLLVIVVVVISVVVLLEKEKICSEVCTCHKKLKY
jgi:uncharacterized membrane protein